MDPPAGQCCPLESSFLSHTFGGHMTTPNLAPSGLLLAPGWGTNPTGFSGPLQPPP